MYVTRILINDRARAFVNARGNICEIHSRICRLFPPVDGHVDLKSHSKYNMLWRYDWDPYNPGSQESIIITSIIPPDPGAEYPEADIETKALPGDWPGKISGEVLSFRLVGNPVRTVKTEGQQRGRKIPLTKPDELERWLRQRFSKIPGDNHSTKDWAQIVTLHNHRSAYQLRDFKHVGTKGDGSRVSINLVQFDGLLRITDAQIARDVVRHGVATGGKSYGAGLLSLGRTNYRYSAPAESGYPRRL